MFKGLSGTVARDRRGDIDHESFRSNSPSCRGFVPFVRDLHRGKPGWWRAIRVRAIAQWLKNRRHSGVAPWQWCGAYVPRDIAATHKRNHTCISARRFRSWIAVIQQLAEGTFGSEYGSMREYVLLATSESDRSVGNSSRTPASPGAARAANYNTSEYLPTVSLTTPSALVRCAAHVQDAEFRSIKSWSMGLVPKIVNSARASHAVSRG